MTPVLAASTGVTKVKVSVAGNDAVEKAMGDALDMLGLRSELKAWAGGMVGAELRRCGDMPDDAAVAAAKVGTAAFFGGGSWAMMHAAKFMGVGLSLDPTGHMEVSMVAELVAAWTGVRRGPAEGCAAARYGDPVVGVGAGRARSAGRALRQRRQGGERAL